MKEVGRPGLPAAEAADEMRLAVVGSGPHAERAAAVLEAHGWSQRSFPRAADLPVGVARPPLLVVIADRLIDASLELKGIGEGFVEAIVICGSVRPGEVRLALAGGVAGILFDDSIGEALVPCLVSVLAGQISVPRGEARQVDAAALSNRERQILALVVLGLSNTDIAEQLVVAESTVKSHLSSAFGKLGVHSRNAAIELILDGERGLGVGILGLDSEPIAG